MCVKEKIHKLQKGCKQEGRHSLNLCRVRAMHRAMAPSTPPRKLILNDQHEVGSIEPWRRVPPLLVEDQGKKFFRSPERTEVGVKHPPYKIIAPSSRRRNSLVFTPADTRRVIRHARPRGGTERQWEAGCFRLRCRLRESRGAHRLCGQVVCT